MSDHDDDGTFMPCVQTRVGHVAVAANDFMLVWGGYTEDYATLSERYIPTDKIDVFHTDLDEGYWTSHKTSGNIPLGTSGAVAILVKHDMYVYGGHTEQGFPSNDLYRCDLRTLTWEKIKPKSEKLPSPRDKFTGCHVNNRLYYFGGYGYNNLSGEDLLAYYGKFVVDNSQNNVSGKGWNDQLLVYDIEENTWSNPACKGFAPIARAAHASMVIDNSLYIFGGRHQEKRLNDLHCLDIDTLTWSGELHIDGPIPCGRSWHSLTAISEDQGFVYGGYSSTGVPLSDAWLINVNLRQWSKIDVPSDQPRLWHTCCGTVNGDILVFGGCINDILNWQEESIHSNEVLKFRLQPSSLQRLCLLVTYKSVTPECWDELPKILSDWLHKKAKLEKRKECASADRSKFKQGSTCAVS